MLDVLNGSCTITVRVQPPMERDRVVVVAGFVQFGAVLAPARTSGPAVDTTTATAAITIVPSATLKARRRAPPVALTRTSPTQIIVPRELPTRNWRFLYESRDL